MSQPTASPSHRPPPAQETVTLTIDGKEITVAKGTLVIRAAEQLGIVVPRFCDHPLLDPAGACRQCIVEVEGQPKPMTSCTTECMDGMVVKTQNTSEMAEQAQTAQLEFLLINHPLDCPMCDKGGECPLQDQALEHGPGESRFIDEKRRYEKPVAVSPNILLDRERCVLCARCTRFANQISGKPFIELFERGALQQVAIFEDEPYLDYFGGNIIQICPVGALTSASYRFRARPFDLESHPSVCGLCSAGCNLNLHTRRGGVMRQMARTNLAVNEAWNCDKGRFAFKFLEGPGRLTEPRVRQDGVLRPTSWNEALETATNALRAADPGRVAVLTGGRLPDEDSYVLGRYAREVLGTEAIDFRTWSAGPDEDDALRAIAARPGVTYDMVESAPLILLVGLDPEEEVPILFLRLRKAWLKKGAKLVSVGARAGSIGELLWKRVRTGVDEEAAALEALRDARSDDPDVQAVADALREAGDSVVVLVGERAGRAPGALAAAGRLADDLGARIAWVPRRNNARGALSAGLLPRDGRGTRQILDAAAEGRIDVLHLVGVDPVRDFDDPALAQRALEMVPTVIVQDLLETDSVDHADVVLPATATHERHGSYTNWEGRRQYFEQAIVPPRLALDDWDILVLLSQRLGGELHYRSLDDIRSDLSTAPSPPAVAWPGSPHEGAGPRTVSGGGSWSPATGADAGGHAAPKRTDDGLALLTYPMLLDHGSMTVGADDLLKTAKPPFAALNRSDARRLGIADGDVVRVSTEHGELHVIAQVEDDVTPGVVFVPANSTRLPARALAGTEAGVVRVRVEAAPEHEAEGPRGDWTRGDAGLTARHEVDH